MYGQPQDYNQAMYGQQQGNDQAYGQQAASSAQGMYPQAQHFQGVPQGYGYTDPQSFNGQPQVPQSFAGEQQVAQSFGGQPQMMDAPSFALQQAEAQMSELDEKRLQKEEAKKQKEMEHLQHEMRSGMRAQTDNQQCARTLCLWGIFNGLMYGLALMGDTWSHTQWHAMGIDQLDLKLGLFNLQFDMRCGSDWLAGQDGGELCKMMQRWTEHDGGHWATKDFAQDICHADKSFCFQMNRLVYAGWIPLIMLPIAATFECLAVLLTYFYWYGKPTTMVRNVADKCAALATFCAGAAVAGYVGMRPFTNGFPRMWGTVAGLQDTTDGVFSGFMEVWIWPIGFAAMCAVIGAAGSSIRTVSQSGLPYHVDHPDPYGIGEIEDVKIQSMKDAQKSYGTA